MLGFGSHGATYFALAATFLAASALAEHSTTTITQKDAAELADAEPKKRPPSSYLHERDDVDKYQELHGGSKHLREADSYLDRLLSEELEKRASMRGFQGMRGKKSEYNLEPAYYGLQPADSAYYGYDPAIGQQLDYYYEKRAPMGFQGTRGKKSALAPFDDEPDKRAPMGFQGMRGKKSLEEVLDELEKRAMMGFQGMRGKKSEEYEEEQQQAEESQNGVEWQKRAPMGFQGMRGRKSSYLDELDELEKRAILGFHGMRGKKGMLYDRGEMPVDIDGYVEKRPMMMGFHGMRGKRSTNYYGSLEGGRYEKRSPYRFFGTRGKKNPRWEMRGKFVGVRGKKWTVAPRQLPSIYDELVFDSSERMAGSARH